MQFHAAILEANGQLLALRPGKSNSFDDIYVDFQQVEENGGTRWSIFLHPKTDVTITRLELQFAAPMPEGTRFFANGYQSWSESKLYELTANIPVMRSIARPYMGRYGDEHIKGIARGRGRLHAWTYTYFKKPGSTLLAGSLSEKTGFTLFEYNHSSQQFTVSKDLDKLQLAHSFPALDVWIGESTESDVFDAWFQTMGHHQPKRPPALGWTSWYRHFTQISEQTVLENTQGLIDSGLPFEYVQIDDGWQTHTGDWFSVKPEFPGGMAGVASKIRQRGFKPGIWIAPFVASARSELVRKHPEWLLKDKNGKPLRVGWNPMWGGWYHALDFYHSGVRDYLSGLFHLAADQWGFELFKLDFLFAVCLAPPPGKTRGAVMWEAMEFLRNLAGNRKILACGVPLGACFGLVDYCRIGGDVHMKWEHRLLAWLRFRERVSTKASLQSTLGRWQLNGRAFGNDPDVFILRTDRQQLTEAQQHTVLTLNSLLGSLLFTSDDLKSYSAEQQTELESAVELSNRRIWRVEMLQTDIYLIDFELEGVRNFAYCNLTHKPILLGDVKILPFETLLLSRPIAMG
ncbi:MAG: alpha-galactosidase [Saprospiraceae bacterium]|nr:alpha-galactosidase [Saprospiraceae bacterium]